jgi:mono/diheme cytochrome c family protein
LTEKCRTARRISALLLAIPLATMADCRPDEKAPAGETTAAAPAPGAPGSRAPGTEAPLGGTAAGVLAPIPGAPPAGATPAMLAQGDSIYHGQLAGGLCYTCHGGAGEGTDDAPPLVNNTWRTGDGSYEFIQKRIAQGMPHPTPPYSEPMLPMGGRQLTPDQIRAVAAYVYSISSRATAGPPAGTSGGGRPENGRR